MKKAIAILGLSLGIVFTTSPLLLSQAPPLSLVQTSTTPDKLGWDEQLFSQDRPALLQAIARKEFESR